MIGSDPSPPSPTPARGLPHWVLPVALLGLAILVISTLPALVARRRLDRTERRLDEEVRAMEQATERIQRGRQALRSDEYVLDRALRELFDPGPRVGAPKLAVAPRRK
jgi:hypothetical protein